MALERFSLLAQTSGTSFGTGTFTTNSVVAGNNMLLLVIVSGMGETDSGMRGGDLTLSGGGLTWTEAAVSTTVPAWSEGTRMFWAENPTAQTFTLGIDCGAFNIHSYRVTVLGFTGYRLRNGSPIGATATGTDADGVGTGAITLSATPEVTSQIVASVFVIEATLDAGTTTPGTGWTELNEASDDGWWQIQAQARTELTSTTVDWVQIHTGSAANLSGAFMLAVEILAALDSPGATFRGLLRRSRYPI